ncbi:RagB/SusD family nutrient uptake outer membrane protein [Sphingobacterium multivorum]|uniref:SusD family n=1 Tax=Sphingobacterium multivorum TaxID=28454 RepID=A0A2X2J8P0_SPHMU|nr:RagB/SusD family nutrient uptake outer membrane protein [Sphingobacterium multivorum]QRQ61096.1 RagB/SusD family nutrient uptake outer membrane protein [Sphingobacterium multivorum]SPZ88256.1 SusD family [Sphingobacterium multivorum]
MKDLRNYLIFCLAIILTGCGKDFLDAKRTSNQVVPKTAKDYLTILSRDNMYYTSSDLAYLGADEYYVKNSADLVAGSQYTPFHQYAYTWQDNPYGNQRNIKDWDLAYERIMYANLALDVESAPAGQGETADRDRARVAARFHRAWNFYQLAQLFCSPYNEPTVAQDPGLPLRLDYDVSVRYDRSSLKEVYDQIINDLTEAENIPIVDDTNPYMPGTTAVQALLAKVYLQQGKFDMALRYADIVLQKKKVLIDYNKLTGSVTDIYGSYFAPYGKNNPAIIFYSAAAVGGVLGATRRTADTMFSRSLDQHDLRKKIYFFKRPDGTQAYTGSYCGYGANESFTGLSVEEMLLIRAECRARSGMDQQALDDINLLRKHRTDADAYHEHKLSDVSDILTYVLTERRKELYMRGIRWEDARRLNQEGRYPVSFTRILDGIKYSLAPNSKKWVWPIPQSEIDANGIEQNQR